MAKKSGAGELRPPNAAVRLDPRSRRSREAILRAAQDLLGRDQPGNLGVDELIRTAGVSKQTFYNHFLDREELTREILDLTRLEFDRRVDEAIAEEPDPARRLARTMCVYAHHALVNPARARLIAVLPLEDAMLTGDPASRTMRILSDGIAIGRLASPAIATGAALVIAATRALVSRIIVEQDSALAIVASQQFVVLILRALGLNAIDAEAVATDSVEKILTSQD